MIKQIIVKDKLGRHIWIRIDYGLRDCCGETTRWFLGRGCNKLNWIKAYKRRFKNMARNKFWFEDLCDKRDDFNNK